MNLRVRVGKLSTPITREKEFIKGQGEARRVLWRERYRSIAKLSLLATVQVVSPKCWPEAVSLPAPKFSLPSLAGMKPG